MTQIPGRETELARYADDRTDSGMTRALTQVLKSQYHAALSMLRDAIERCPDPLWLDTRPRNAFWQVAYHTLYFTHLYLGQDLESFQAWAGHQGDPNEDGTGGTPDLTNTFPPIRPYTRDEVLAYWAVCDRMVDAAVDSFDLQRRDSGFHWYQVSKLEHQMINLRHIQHHTAQLADRLRFAEDVGTQWIGSRNAIT